MRKNFLFCLLLVVMLGVLLPCHAEDMEAQPYDYIWAYHRGLAQIEKDGKIGLINEAGEVVLPAEYDEIFNRVTKGMFLLKKEKRYGLADPQGKLVLKVEWNRISPCGEGTWAISGQSSKQGHANRNGEIIIPPIWQDVWGFSEGLLVVKDENGLCGYMNKAGEMVIEPQYTWANSFSEGYATPYIRTVNEETGKRQSTYYVIDHLGNTVLESTQGAFSELRNGITIFTVLADFVPNYDVVDHTNAMVVDAVGKEPEPGKENDVIRVLRYGMMDWTGTVLVEPIWDEAEWETENDLIAVANDAYKLGYIDGTGRVIIEPQGLWEPRSEYSEGLVMMCVGFRDGANIWRCFDEFGDLQFEVLIDYEDEYLYFSEGKLLIHDKDGRGVFIDRMGRIILSEDEENGVSFEGNYNEGLALISVDGKMGFMNHAGEIVLEPKWDDASNFADGLAHVELDGQTGCINKQGELVSGIKE